MPCKPSTTHQGDHDSKDMASFKDENSSWDVCALSYTMSKTIYNVLTYVPLHS